MSEKENKFLERVIGEDEDGGFYSRLSICIGGDCEFGILKKIVQFTKNGEIKNDQ